MEVEVRSAREFFAGLSDEERVWHLYRRVRMFGRLLELEAPAFIVENQRRMIADIDDSCTAEELLARFEADPRYTFFCKEQDRQDREDKEWLEAHPLSAEELADDEEEPN